MKRAKNAKGVIDKMLHLILNCIFNFLSYIFNVYIFFYSFLALFLFGIGNLSVNN